MMVSDMSFREGQGIHVGAIAHETCYVSLIPQVFTVLMVFPYQP